MGNNYNEHQIITTAHNCQYGHSKNTGALGALFDQAIHCHVIVIDHELGIVLEIKECDFYLRLALLIFAQSHSMPSLTPTPVRALLDLKKNRGMILLDNAVLNYLLGGC